MITKLLAMNWLAGRFDFPANLLFVILSLNATVCLGVEYTLTVKNTTDVEVHYKLKGDDSHNVLVNPTECTLNAGDTCNMTIEDDNAPECDYDCFDTCNLIMAHIDTWYNSEEQNYTEFYIMQSQYCAPNVTTFTGCWQYKEEQGAGSNQYKTSVSGSTPCTTNKSGGIVWPPNGSGTVTIEN